MMSENQQGDDRREEMRNLHESGQFREGPKRQAARQWHAPTRSANSPLP